MIQRRLDIEAVTRLIDIADYISVDDLKMTPVGLPSLSTFVKGQFARPDRDSDDAEDKFTFERLGGVLFLQPEGNNGEAIDYRVDFLENPGVLPACALPAAVPQTLSAMRDGSRARRAKILARM